MIDIHAIRNRSIALLRTIGMRRLLWGLVVVAILVAVLLALNILQQLLPLFWVPEFEALFYEDLGLSDSLSKISALIAAFTWSAFLGTAIGWIFLSAFWTFNARKFVLGLIGTLIVYGHVPLLHYFFGKENCFNQRTGQPIKWYVVEPGGSIVLYDSAGFDKNGVAKRPVTSDVCRFRDRIAKGIRPHLITADPRTIEFFDDASGAPRVWYFRAPNGIIELFDGEGLHPVLGEALSPITKAVAMEIRSAADQAQTAARESDLRKANEEKRAAAEAAEREAVQTKERRRQSLAEIFATSSYDSDVVILGAAAKQSDEASDAAAKALVVAMSREIGSRGKPVDQFRPAVYSSGNFDKLFGGNSEALVESGLAARMRVALLTRPDVGCKPATMTQTMACTVTVEMRIVRQAGTIRSRQWTEVGAGGTSQQAARRAIEILIERNPTWLDESQW
jgi:hypothetical protein